MSELVNQSPVSTLDGSMLIGSQHTSVFLIDGSTGQLLRCVREGEPCVLPGQPDRLRWGTCAEQTLLCNNRVAAAGRSLTLMASWASWMPMP